jgi:hypothetical protein
VAAAAAVAWGRARADRVLIRVGDAPEYRSAGTTPVEGLEPWRGIEPGRRRSRGYEHLDLVADEPIAWTVRIDARTEVDGQRLAEAARAAMPPGVHAAPVVARRADGRAQVQFIVHARSQTEAQALAHDIHSALAGCRRTANAVAYFETSLDPCDGVRPLAPPPPGP